MKLHHIILTIAAVGAFTACDPLTESYSLDESTLSADQLKLTVKAQTVDGRNSNTIVMENNSPILSEWTVGDKKLNSAYAEAVVNYTGQQKVTFRGMNADTKTFTEKEFTVQVDTIAVIPSEIETRLCIGQQGAPAYFGTTFDTSKITVSVNEGVVTVTNPNPVMTEWDCGGVTSDKNIAQLKMTRPGTFPLKATFTLANGEKVDYDLGNVYVKPFNLPEIVMNLVGKEGKKTWTWDDKNFYGFGGYGHSMGPEWYSYDAATMELYSSYFGMTGEATGSMTLDVEGNFSVEPTGRTGTFTYDFDDKVENWSVSKLKVDNPILFGMAISMTTYQPSYLPTEFYIVKCDADHLVLAAISEKNITPAPYASCVFWCFKAK